MARGQQLVVVFQDFERVGTGLTVWLTVENFGDEPVRWFGPTATAFVDGTYKEVQPDLHNEVGGHLITDIYPSEQFTFSYHFSLPPETPTPKFLACQSWDHLVSFSWYSGV